MKTLLHKGLPLIQATDVGTPAQAEQTLEDAWLRDSISIARLVPKSESHPICRFVHRATFEVNRRGGRAFTYLAVRSMNPMDPIPPPRQERINLVPYGDVDKRIPLRNVLVADRIPTDEKCKLEPAVFGFQRFVSKVFPVKTTDIPEISTDLDTNVNRSVPAYFFRLPWVSRPQTPIEIAQRPNDVLGALSLAGPFAAYIEKRGAKYVIDLAQMSKYPVKAGLAPLGFVASMHYDDATGQMITDGIDLPAENKRVLSGDDPKEWQRAQRIALATLSTHMTTVRHLGWAHIGVGEAFAAITSTHLSADHPVHTILHPHNFRTTATNNYRVPSLISDETSALPSVFSYDKKHILQLLDDEAGQFDLGRLDPIHDAERRGVIYAPIDYPYLRNARLIWSVMERHVRSYLQTFYSNDEEVRQCAEVQNWYQALSQVGGAHAYAGPLGIEALVRLITVAMYTGSIEHENVGNLIVNYTTLPQVPSNVRIDGSLPTEAEFQAYMNLVMLTSTPFDPLLGNNYPGMSAQGKEIMTRMCNTLQELDDVLQAEKPVPLHTILPGKCAVSAAT